MHSMDEPRSGWKSPGGVAVIAVALIINLVADWFIFKPRSVLSLVLGEVLVLGIIAFVVILITDRTPQV
jgi:hypothetical protein